MLVVRNCKYSLNNANARKRAVLDGLFADYAADLQYYVDLLWEGQLPLRKNLSSADLPINRLAHSRWRQMLYKQASEMVRAVREHKRNKRKSKPTVNRVSLCLDERVVDFHGGDEVGAEFDAFLQLTLPYFNETGTRALKLRCPFRHHFHHNNLVTEGYVAVSSIKLKKEGNGYFLYRTYKKEVKSREEGTPLGIDSGVKKLFVTSEAQLIGTDMQKVYDKIACKQSGSKAKERTLVERDERINRLVKSVDLAGVKEVFVEDLRGLNKVNNERGWVYAYALGKMEHWCQRQGVRTAKVSPAYTSQQCSACAAIHQESRQGERYRCVVCGMEADADYNAAVNILRRGVYGPPRTKRVETSTF